MHLRWVIWSSILALAALGCQDYGSERNPECLQDADCNPGKTCGQMIRCVDGRCDAEQTFELPCSQACGEHEDCPAGMHCRWEGPGFEGVCVADGTCLDVDECIAWAQAGTCPGRFACQQGSCAWICEDLYSCSQDSECALVDAGCCCGSRPEDYTAVRTDQQSTWQQRPECREVACPGIACTVPDSIRAACVQGACAVAPAATDEWRRCNADADCVLVSQECCGSESMDGYTAIRMARLADWFARAECAGIQCEECLHCPQGVPRVCIEDRCGRAACQQGRCSPALEHPQSCARDADCARASGHCGSCDCENGYPDFAMNAGYLEAWQSWLEALCSLVGMCQPGPFGERDACTDRPAICSQGRCMAAGQQCECDAYWDPVCAVSAGQVASFPSPCEAECAGWELVDYSRCECMVLCDCDDPFSCDACASNGRTYHCGYWAIECNDLEPLYPGACDPDCGHCAYLNRLPIQACGEYFHTYAEICYADCLGHAYWHQGPCLPGEGEICGGLAGVECPDGLACAYEQLVPDAQGVCVERGSCIEASDCEGQGLDTPACVGSFFCENHVCEYICVP
ncbi:MAG: hypothetical protein JXR96_17865 [Deltaproteobacteria bacterium]|nr:hypothetical protein [Deltaproteobacteria bacterium]